MQLPIRPITHDQYQNAKRENNALHKTSNKANYTWSISKYQKITQILRLIITDKKFVEHGMSKARIQFKKEKYEVMWQHPSYNQKWQYLILPVFSPQSWYFRKTAKVVYIQNATQRLNHNWILPWFTRES